MYAPLDHATNARNERSLRRIGHDAGRSSDDVHNVAFPGPRSDGVPVGVKSADGNGDAGTQSQLFRPLRREFPGDFV